VRDAVYDELSPVRRTRLHRRIADALVERFGSGAAAPAAQLAFHYSASLALGTGEAALQWARRAAGAASTRAADAEAARMWELALRALVAVRPDDTASRVDLLVERSSSLRRAWDLDAAREVLDQALELAVQLDDPLRLAEAAALYGGVNLWTWRQVGTVGERTVTLLEDAIPRLPPDAHVTRSRAAGALGVELYYGRDVERSLAAGDESVREAEICGDPAELARALNNSFITRWRPGREAEMLPLVERMLSLPGLAPEVESIGLMHRTMLLQTLDRVPEVAGLVPRLRELREIVRMPDVAAQLDFTLATWAGLHGDRATAADLVERGWTARYADSTMWGGEWVYLLGRLSLGVVEDLDAIADRLAELCVGEASDLVRPTAVLALVEVGRLDEARALAGSGPRLGDSWADTFNAVQWALAATRLDLPVAPWRAWLEPRADLLIVAGSNLAVWGSMHWPLALLAEADGDRPAAARHWAAADEVDGRLGLGRAPRPGEGLVRRYPGPA